jgi:hypothetical protein
MTTGVCKLTGTTGAFVRSHLLPEALTRSDRPSAGLAQFHSGRQPARRWTSWYDYRLVTKEGEVILAKLDDWAIKVLRQHKLVWSGWTDGAPPDLNAKTWGIREIEGIDPKLLRLFFLSLLWRAGATERTEFSEVTLPPTDLNLLGRMLVESNPQPLDFYPTTLLQLSTRGPTQNLVPLAGQKAVPNLDGTPPRIDPFFRFYFDGLVAHVHRQSAGETDQFGPMMVGAGLKLLLPTIPYEGSVQHNNLLHVLRETRWK